DGEGDETGKGREGGASPYDAARKRRFLSTGRKDCHPPISSPHRTAQLSTAMPDATASPASSPLTHFDAQGQAHMVDVAAKAHTHRIAVAEGRITMQPATLTLIQSGTAKKGDVLGIARIAGIQGAKKTSDLIPLCHPIGLTRVAVDFDIDEAASTVI